MNSLTRIDPVELEPLHHFHPGTRVLRVGAWPSDLAAVVHAATRDGVRSVAVPAGLGHVHELARLAGLRGIRLVGSCEALDLSRRFASLRWLDAVVVRLPSLDPGKLESAFAEIARLLGESVWVELTCCVGDGGENIDALARAIVDALGPEPPLHLAPAAADSANCEEARHARWIAQANGLHWVYGGDPADARARCSWCPGCDGLLADRSEGSGGPLLDDTCPSCGWAIPGRFPRQPRRRSSHTMARVVARSVQDTPPSRVASGDRK